jgi:hypothetical protein
MTLFHATLLKFASKDQLRLGSSKKLKTPKIIKSLLEGILTFQDHTKMVAVVKVVDVFFAGKKNIL